MMKINKVELNAEYVQNSLSHLRKYVSKPKEKAFSSNVKDEILKIVCN